MAWFWRPPPGGARGQMPPPAPPLATPLGRGPRGLSLEIEKQKKKEKKDIRANFKVDLFQLYFATFLKVGNIILSAIFWAAPPPPWNMIFGYPLRIPGQATVICNKKANRVPSYGYIQYQLSRSSVLTGCQLSRIWRDSHAFDLTLTQLTKLLTHLKKSHAYPRNLKKNRKWSTIYDQYLHVYSCEDIGHINFLNMLIQNINFKKNIVIIELFLLIDNGITHLFKTMFEKFS